MVTLRASLTVSQEVPQPATAGVGARGTFTATLTGRILSWHLKVSHLSGAPAASVIHTGGRGVAGAALVTLRGSSSTSISGTTVLTAAQVAKLLGGATYINVGTHLNPHGEIRGQIVRA